MKTKYLTNFYYSNCFIEAVKAKIKNPLVKIAFVPRSEKGTPHFLWSDGKHDYDFGVEAELKWYQIIWFKGRIRQRALGFNERYKNSMKTKNKDGVFD